jgi:hypothetical protein
MRNDHEGERHAREIVAGQGLRRPHHRTLSFGVRYRAGRPHSLRRIDWRRHRCSSRIDCWQRWHGRFDRWSWGSGDWRPNKPIRPRSWSSTMETSEPPQRMRALVAFHWQMCEERSTAAQESCASRPSVRGLDCQLQSPLSLIRSRERHLPRLRRLSP